MVTTVELGIPGTDIRPGDHVCAFYRGSEERDGLLLPALATGLRAGDKCLCIVDSTPAEALVESLSRRATTDVRDAITRGQLELRTSEEVYLRGGRFSADQMFQLLDDFFARALALEGYPLVRSAGEMIWAAQRPPGVEELFYYEAMLNLVFPFYRGVGICLYDLDHFSSDIVLEVLETHSKVLIGGMVLENPYFLAPDAAEFREKWDLPQSMYDRYWSAPDG
jgi:hypothetical protein